MAKKVLCILLTMIMLVGTLSIIGHAGYNEDWYLDTTWSECEYDSSKDWKYQLEDRFLWAYNKSGVFNEVVLEKNLSFWKDEIISDYRAAVAKYEAAETDEEKEAANRTFYDLYMKMWTPVIQDDPYWDQYWYEYRDVSKEKINFRYEIQDQDGNVITQVVPGGTYKLIAYVSCNFWSYTITPSFIYDRPYVNIDMDNSLTIYADEQRLTEMFTDFGFQTGDGFVQLWTPAFEAVENSQELYKILEICLQYKDDRDNAKKLYDDEKMCGWDFTVDADTPVGTTIKFWNDALYSVQPWINWYENTTSAAQFPCCMERAASYECAYMVDDSNPIFYSDYDNIFDEPRYWEGQTITYEAATAEVVSAEADLADYTELDNSIAAYEELESGKALYTADSWSAYENAYNSAKALARDLAADEQATVDSANAALVDAKAALAENSVVSATVANRGDTSVTVNVEVTGTPTALRLANSDSSLTYNRTDATITTAENGNENWEIEVAASGAANSYTVSALYGTAVANQTATFSYDALKDPNFISLDIPGAYSEEGYKDRVYKGKNEMKVVTTQDVWKIQFVQDGGTYTYATDYTPYVDNEDGTRTWTINHVFGPVGDVHLDVRIRLRNTSFYNVNESIDVEVVY